MPRFNVTISLGKFLLKRLKGRQYSNYTCFIDYKIFRICVYVTKCNITKKAQSLDYGETTI